jgi:hypothetical protein
MGFKGMSLKSILPVLLPALLLMGLLSWKFFFKTDSPVSENDEAQNSLQNQDPIPQTASEPAPVIGNEDDVAIQQQLDRDRLQQKQTKDLKIKLEQINLELEGEKALAQLDQIKKENRGAFNDPAGDGQNELPEIKVDYIGGDSVKKEAILSIGGTSYQVKERSSPVANIQVVTISDSNVTLHFGAPQNLTKTIDYKPE